MKKHFPELLLAVLSLIVLNTCIQIEVWNWLAEGNMLPNREGGKLRYMTGTTEQGWRRRESRFDPSLKTGRPLTEQEQLQFAVHRKKAIRRNNVVSWTRGMGTLQYLLAPLAVFFSLVMVLARKNSKSKLFAGVCFMANGIAIAVMLYRGYFND